MIAGQQPVVEGARVPLARFRSFYTHSPDEAVACGTRDFHRHRLEPKRAAPFFAQHNMATVGQISLSYFEYGPEVSLIAPELGRYYLLQIPISGMLRVSVGAREVELAPGQATMLNPLRAVQLDWHNSSQLVVRIDRRLLQRTVARYLPGYADTYVDFNETTLQTREQVSGIRNLVRIICQQVELDDSPMMRPSAQRHLTDLLLTTILYTFPHNLSDRLSPFLPQVAPKYVRRAESYIHANAHRSIGIADLVAVAGVSERSLQYGFRRFRGTGPMGMLKSVRLDRARADLLGGATTSRTVTDIAIKWGFGHQGNFARDYRRRFGENPSATVRRSGHELLPND